MKHKPGLIKEAKKLMAEVKDEKLCPHDRGFCVGAAFVLNAALAHHESSKSLKALRAEFEELYTAAEGGFWRGFWGGKVWAIDFILR
jgi:hypothetical protein